eukprot:353516-Chlamydomonas_euryale.AAC.4
MRRHRHWVWRSHMLRAATDGGGGANRLGVCQRRTSLRLNIVNKQQCNCALAQRWYGPHKMTHSALTAKMASGGHAVSAAAASLAYAKKQEGATSAMGP